MVTNSRFQFVPQNLEDHGIESKGLRQKWEIFLHGTFMYTYVNGNFWNGLSLEIVNLKYEGDSIKYDIN